MRRILPAPTDTEVRCSELLRGVLTARRLLEEQRYSELAKLIEAVGVRGWDEEAWTLLVRCRLEQGLIREAWNLVEGTQGCFAAGSGPDLWSRFVIVLSSASPVSLQTLDSFIENCERNAALAAPTVGALAGDLRAQGLALRFTLLGLSPARRAVISDAWVSAAEASPFTPRASALLWLKAGLAVEYEDGSGKRRTAHIRHVRD
ncbi:hypothetical protein [Streptomyces sp. NPDC056190]|uniref:hypothetical protein n=1 Tax=Streptomyces sp. NPDC056190 TaxID=3345741 RepID=UPI0035D78434